MIFNGLTLQDYIIRFSAFDQDRYGNPTEIGSTVMSFDDFRDFTSNKLVLSCSLKESVVVSFRECTINPHPQPVHISDPCLLGTMHLFINVNISNCLRFVDQIIDIGKTFAMQQHKLIQKPEALQCNIHNFLSPKVLNYMIIDSCLHSLR
jgi:hypothetical protein